MSEPFEIKITDSENKDIYKLSGTFEALLDGKAYDFKIDTNTAYYMGFGGSVWVRLPKIALRLISVNFSNDILAEINKMVDYENASAEFAKGLR